MLTDTTFRNLEPKAKPYKAYGRDGMYVTVSTTGTATFFRYDHRLNGRRGTLIIRTVWTVLYTIGFLQLLDLLLVLLPDV
nr:Arm DNA-binding domain-containing protein [Azoarcus sp. L1K30]